MTARELLKTLANVKDLDKEVVIFDNKTKIYGQSQGQKLQWNCGSEGKCIVLHVVDMEPKESKELLQGNFSRI